MTERLTDNWTSVASQGEEETGVASFFGGAMSKQMLQQARGREREEEREAAVLFYVAAVATPACLQL